MPIPYLEERDTYTADPQHNIYSELAMLISEVSFQKVLTLLLAVGRRLPWVISEAERIEYDAGYTD